MTIDFKALAEPFSADEVEWRIGQRTKDGKKATLLCYLTARAVQERLDAVAGPGGWRDSYVPIIDGGKAAGFLCTLELEVSPGVWVGKSDASDVTDIEALKGGVSGALKRAAVKWGIGRYLYGVDSRYHTILDGYGPDGSVYSPIGDPKDKKPGHIIPPKLPDWALPSKKATTPPLKEVPPPEEPKAGTSSGAALLAHLIPEDVAAKLVEKGWLKETQVEDLRDLSAFLGRGDPVAHPTKILPWLEKVLQADLDAWQQADGAFETVLRDSGVGKNDVESWCVSAGKSIPRRMNREERDKLVGWLRDAGGISKVKAHSAQARKEAA